MLKVRGLCKSYAGFRLDDVSFELPQGYIMGFVGTNGAGKSTTIKSIINMVGFDSGEVEVFGRQMPLFEAEVKEDLGIMMTGYDFYQNTRVKRIINEFKPFFKNWDDALCKKLLSEFEIDVAKRYMELSTGMKAKLGLVLALSHKPRLLILDEPTSGLDPAAREKVLNIIHEFVEDGTRSVLFSTHITSDLDKCADYIVLIEKGRVIMNDTKDSIIDSHFVIKGGTEDLNEDLKKRAIGLKTNAYGFSALIKCADLTENDKVQTQKPNIEDIILFYSKEEIAPCNN